MSFVLHDAQCQAGNCCANGGAEGGGFEDSPET